MALSATEIQSRVDTGDVTVIDAVKAQYGNTCAGCVAHALWFPMQVRDGNSVSQATVRVSPNIDASQSAEAVARRLSAAALTLGHGLSKKGYNAFYRASCGMPASYDTIMKSFTSLLDSSVCVIVEMRSQC